MSAAYTPKTINFIRERANLGVASLAKHLGWDIDMLCRVAKKHGIDLFAPMSDAATGRTESRIDRDGVAPAAARNSPEPLFGTVDGVLRCNGKSALVRGPLCQTVLRFLLAARKTDRLRFLSSGDMAASIGNEATPADVTSSIPRLRRNILPADCTIQTRMGPNGGYRLAILDREGRIVS